MKKLFGLALLALAFLAPDLAQAAARFAVCSTTCTWDNTSTAMWSTTSGGATGASAPTSADSVTLDANTCVGGTTCTITTFSGTISVIGISMGACTASTSGCILDASVNNTNFTISGAGSAALNNNGAGTRTLNMGSGTWTLSSSGATWNVNSSATLNAGTSTIAFTGSGGAGTNRTFTGGGKTYSTVTVASATGGVFSVGDGSNTIGTLTISAPNKVIFPQGLTNTITTFTNVTGTSSQQVAFTSGNQPFGTTTISSANNWTCTWCVINLFAFTGGGTFTATNSFDAGGGNTGITITPPSAGGGGRIIGG